MYYNRNSVDNCPSPINNNNYRNSNHLCFKYNFFSNKSLERYGSLKNKEEQPIPTETDFSHILNIIANERNKNINTNNFTSNSNIKTLNNISKEEKESSHSLSSNFFINK